MTEEVRTENTGPELRRRLRYLRLRRHASLEDVARAIGTSSAHLSSIETGKIDNPGYKILLALAAFYRLPIGELLGEPAPDIEDRKLSFEAALEVLRTSASPRFRELIVVIGELVLNQSESSPHRSRKPSRSTRAA
jgi:transcriptional regulator with XRE-family HTH domain